MGNENYKPAQDAQNEFGAAERLIDYFGSTAEALNALTAANNEAVHQGGRGSTNSKIDTIYNNDWGFTEFHDGGAMWKRYYRTVNNGDTTNFEHKSKTQWTKPK